ncbi:MAG: hypothetical protein ABR540_00875, partial [Acidimicrobiales bacterium]
GGRVPEDDNEDPQPEKLARARRRKAVLAVPALLLAIGLVAAFLVDGSDDDESTVRVAAPASTSTSRRVTTTSRPVESTTSTSASASTTSTPTTVATTTVSTEVPPTSEPAGEPSEPRCEASHFAATARPDKTFYRPGEQVTITGTFTNVSGSTCYWVSIQSTLEIRDSSGRLVGPSSILHADGFRWSPVAPGETTSHGMSWDQRICETPPCVPAPRGAYTATLNVDPFGSASTSFTLLPA